MRRYRAPIVSKGKEGSKGKGAKEGSKDKEGREVKAVKAEDKGGKEEARGGKAEGSKTMEHRIPDRGAAQSAPGRCSVV